MKLVRCCAGDCTIAGCSRHCRPFSYAIITTAIWLTANHLHIESNKHLGVPFYHWFQLIFEAFACSCVKSLPHNLTLLCIICSATFEGLLLTASHVHCNVVKYAKDEHLATGEDIKQTSTQPLIQYRPSSAQRLHQQLHQTSHFQCLHWHQHANVPKNIQVVGLACNSCINGSRPRYPG